VLDDPFYRYFLAWIPSPHLCGVMGRIRDSIGPMPTYVSDWRLHMTLAVLAQSRKPDPAILGEVTEALRDHRLFACTIALQRLAVGSGSAVLLTAGRQDEVRAQQASLMQCLVGHRIVPTHPRKFTPHVTLGYGPQTSGSRAIGPILWLADQLVLIESWVGRTVHRVLARWALPHAEPRQYSIGFASLDAKPGLVRPRRRGERLVGNPDREECLARSKPRA